MLAESRAFFRELITNNLNVTNIVDSDFLMLNERLAEHYRFVGPKGAKIQRVAIPANWRARWFHHPGKHPQDYARTAR